ncbi:MmgE/PrpD family protein [Micromonospora cremea]|uniref:2-methylcitrate dehydratase PrpD n=1 Tax=Micromonospora cremea TaxID=709881 RepID=A0A1N5VKA2_9ACTN|nr:MmgE/PrpD family protein [Micromonospora cremea]SIM72747.1 2-methylcitrate dehydratase PrpD [Micromonospora cremea]
MEAAPSDPIRALVHHACTARFTDLPEQTVAAVQRAMLDTVGAGIAGTSTPMGRIVTAAALETGGRPDSTVWGYRQRVPAAEAAFVNAIMARCRELDDVHEGSPVVGMGHGGHVSVMVVPAVIAVAESLPHPVSGAELITAIAVGSDLIPRLRMAAGSAGRLGFEGPAVAPFGVAAAVGRLYGFDEDTMANAMGAAYAHCAGNVQATRDGAWDVWLNAGIAARAGFVAADLARRGHHGTGAPLLGAAGLYPLYFRGEYHERGLLTELGQTFEGTHLSTKLYSSCKYTHNPIYTLTELARQNGITAADIERISVLTNSHEMRVVVLDQEGQHKHEPATVGAAQFSLPFVLAIALVHGDVFPDTLTEESLHDPETLALAKRVVVQVDPAKDELLKKTGYPPDDVEIRTWDGRTVAACLPYTKGHPRNPVTFDEVVTKFERCCALSELSPSANVRAAFVDDVHALPTLSDCRHLVADLFRDAHDDVPVAATAA